MSDYRDDLAAAHARIDALEAEKAGERHDTDPDELVPVFHDPVEVFANEPLRERLDEVNDRNPWIRWTALAVGIAMLAGAAIEWCSQ